jgi:hypothetical protein
MEGQTRYRLNINKNSKGWGYEYTIDSTEYSPEGLVKEARDFKDLIETEIKQWTLDSASEGQG